MALDTGSTHATIDSNTLYLLDYNIRDNIGKVEVETANGIIKTGIFEIGVFTSIGITKKEFQIQAYDFLANGILSEYDGILGIDFFEKMKFCIDTNKNLIAVD